MPGITLQTVSLMAASVLTGTESPRTLKLKVHGDFCNLLTVLIKSGAMLSLSTMVVPVFLDTNSSGTNMVQQWSRLYHYGHIYLPALSVMAAGLYEYVGLCQYASGSKYWPFYAVAGVTTITMVPFTWVFMSPTNGLLFGLEASIPSTTVDLTSVQGLVVKWGWLHAVRSLFPLAGAVLGCIGILQELGADRDQGKGSVYPCTENK